MLINKFYNRIRKYFLGPKETCPVCKTKTAEYWAQGRVKKYKNNCCSSACYHRSREYIQSDAYQRRQQQSQALNDLAVKQDNFYPKMK